MDITYLGHSCFKLRTAGASLVTDPFSNGIGMVMPKVSADVVTVSHDHDDHNNVGAITGTARREKPFIIDAPGEYEIGGVSVFGVDTYHDEVEGAKRGKNAVFSILMDGLSVVHLGDLGHELTSKQVQEINGVDILLCPVGGVYTIGPVEAAKVVTELEPSIVIPMHYKTPLLTGDAFADLKGVDDFIKELGVEQVERTDKLSVTKVSLPEEMRVVVLEVDKK